MKRLKSVAKPELGTKRVCPACGIKYYDLNRNPIVCPSCGTVFEVVAPTRAAAAAAERKPEPVVVEAEPAAELEPEADTISLEEVEEEAEAVVGPEAEAEDEAVELPEDEIEVEEDDEAVPDPFLEEEEEEGDDVRASSTSTRRTRKSADGARPCISPDRRLVSGARGAPKTRATLDGAVAQLGERVNGIHEVSGSIPLGSTIQSIIKHKFRPQGVAETSKERTKDARDHYPYRCCWISGTNRQPSLLRDHNPA